MRLHTLDYLRGFAALGIMVYHYLSWTYHIYDASTTLGRIGVYGVSIFYVLSGLTLNVVYSHKMNNRHEVKDFFIKRIFRIYPLLWIATIVTTILMMFDNLHPGRMRFLLNVTGLFGFVTPADAIANGAWSIGNELVFYLVFPLLILAMRRRVLFIPLLISFGLYCFFAFFILDANSTLAASWPVYTNPLNQLFLFVAGFVLGMFKFKNTRVALALLAGSIAAFILLPSSGDLINITIGSERMVYTLLSIIICYSFYVLNSKLPFLHKPLSRLGEASYSVYLLHPIVFNALVLIIGSSDWLWMVGIPLTLVLAYWMYLKLETPFVKIGKVVSKGGGKREVVTV